MKKALQLLLVMLLVTILLLGIIIIIIANPESEAQLAARTIKLKEVATPKLYELIKAGKTKGDKYVEGDYIVCLITIEGELDGDAVIRAQGETSPTAKIDFKGLVGEEDTIYGGVYLQKGKVNIEEYRCDCYTNRAYLRYLPLGAKQGKLTIKWNIL